MSKITSINLSGKNLVEIPEDVYTHGNLRKLKLSGNQIKSIGKSILKLKRLRVLDLSNNRLSQLHASIFQLPHLETLIISNNAIKSLPKQIANARNLKVLIAGNNKITNINLNIIPDSIVKLNLSNNRISNFDWLNRLINLRSLWIDGGSISEDVINHIIKAHPNLLRLYISGSRLGNLINSPMKFQQEQGQKELKDTEPNIFISYSHKDREWLNRLQTHLKVLQYLYGQINYWDDTKIGTGDKWLKEIEENLKSATIAILMVSTDFLASDFVMRKEVPQLLDAANRRGVRIMPLILSPCLFEDSAISQYQAVNTPEEALEELSKPQQEKIFLKLMIEIKKHAIKSV